MNQQEALTDAQSEGYLAEIEVGLIDSLLEEATKPWGAWKGISRGERWQVKILHLAPGSAISMQRHAHRAERWIVLQGTIGCYVEGEMDKGIGPFQSAYVPTFRWHRMVNVGRMAALICEIQYGEYLGEDDLERASDDYGRKLGKVDPKDV